MHRLALADRVRQTPDVASSSRLQVSNDCVDPRADEEDDGCFHAGMDRNTGVMILRDGSVTRDILDDWRVRIGLVQGPENDQTAFDDLIRGRIHGHRRLVSSHDRRRHFEHKRAWCHINATTEDSTLGTREDVPLDVPLRQYRRGDRHIFLVCVPNITRRLRFGILPIQHFANGHTFFVQQLHLQGYPMPHAIHFTYQFGDTRGRWGYHWGKRQRMREAGFWKIDPEHDTTARHLVARDSTPLPLGVAWDLSDVHARGRQHVEHVSGALQRLALGLIVAIETNWSLVFPPLWCYCDKYWSRLTRCTIGPQALETQRFPFPCPMDHVLDVEAWHQTPGVQFKHHSHSMAAVGASSDAAASGVHPWVGVDLVDAHRVVPCVKSNATRQRYDHLFDQLFRSQWCFRPIEMKEPRFDAATNATTDVCVWGFRRPQVPPVC